MNKTILHIVLFFRECRPPPSAVSHFILITKNTGALYSFTDEKPPLTPLRYFAPDALTSLLPRACASPWGHLRPVSSCAQRCGCLPLSPAHFLVFPCTGQLLPVSFLSIHTKILASSDTGPSLTLLKVAPPKVISYLLILKPSSPLTVFSLLEGRSALCNTALHSLFFQLAFLWPLLAF